jgi:hypothetical protein
MKLTMLTVALAWALGGSALAQNGEETIVLLPEGVELPDVVTAALDLPKDENGEYRASAEGVAHSAKGLDIANAAREDGRAFGEQTAALAKENREDHARGRMPELSDLRPDQVPDHAALPELPERPALPELPDRPELPDNVPPNPAGH